jgi:HEPN domain-containing protein
VFAFQDVLKYRGLKEKWKALSGNLIFMRPPLWGNFVDHADWDLLSFGWLYQGGLLVPAFYHATQAVEKYLKALTLSILDPNGEIETVLNNRWLRTHDLALLAERCAVKFSFYAKPEIVIQLKRFQSLIKLHVILG